MITGSQRGHLDCNGQFPNNPGLDQAFIRGHSSGATVAV